MSLESFKRSVLKKSGSYNFYKNAYEQIKYEERLSDKIDKSISSIGNDCTYIKNQLNYQSNFFKNNSLNISKQLDNVCHIVDDNFGSLRADLDIVRNKVDLIEDDLNKVVVSSEDQACRLDDVFGVVKRINNDINLVINNLDKNITENKKKLDSLNDKINIFEESSSQFNNKLNLLDNQLTNIINFLKNYNEINKILVNLNKIDATAYFNQSFLNEIKYANIFNDTIKDSKWLTNKSFSLNNGAANYSFLYVLYRILDEIQPKSILEFGLGQTTKMTSQYVSFFNNADLTVVEDDKEWIDYFCNLLKLSNNINILHCDKENILIDSFECWKYKNVNDLIDNKLFDFIIIDGPIGYNQEYPRSNILDLIDNLADDFVIILDDYDRKGEQNTSNKLFDLLKKKNIKFNKIIFKGLKNQLVIFSENNSLVGWF